MTDYSFQVMRNPPDLDEHRADVFEDWLETNEPGQTHAR
jgi:hypothetical protein